MDLEFRERDLERGKSLFRWKRGKVRYLDGSGHKGLADLRGLQLPCHFYVRLLCLYKYATHIAIAMDSTLDILEKR